MANGYRAGGNAKFFAPDGNMGKAKEAIMKRLAFEDGDGEDYPASLLAFPMKRSQYETKCSTVMSLTTRLLPWEVQSGKHDSFPGGETAFKTYNAALALQQIHFGEDLRASENMDYISQVCFFSFAAEPLGMCIRVCVVLTIGCVAFCLCHRARPTTRSASLVSPLLPWPLLTHACN